MGLFRKNSRKGSGGRRGDTGQENAAEDSGLNLYLYLSDTEWRAQLVSRDGTAAGDSMGDAFIIAKDSGRSFAEMSEIIQRAVKAVDNGQKRKLGTVSIVLSDPGIALLDNLDQNFSSANVAKVRQYGAESLHCDEVSYGFLRFGPGEATAGATARPDLGVFGFADTALLRRFLGQLDRLAVKTVLVAPVVQNTVFDAQSRPDATACGVYMGARSTVVVVGNAAHGAITTRRLPVGLYSLVDAVAGGNNVAIGEALAALGRRDCLSQVLLTPEAGDQNGQHVPGQFERLLGKPVRMLGDEIDRTLQYFEVQRMAGRPDAIRLFGPVARIKGLAEWLGNRLGVEVTDAGETILDDLIHRPRTEGLNLLEGAKSPLITLGRVNYAWDKDRFRPEHELDSDEVAEEKAAAGILSGKTAARREPTADRSAVERQPAGRRRTGLFGRRKVDEAPKAAVRARRRAGLPPDEQKGSRAGFALLALFAFVSLYGGYVTFITPKINEFKGVTNAYLDTLHRNAVLRKQKTLAMEGTPVKQVDASGNDKVLWTEKFLALGCYATKAIWLTDVFLTTATRTAAGKPEITQKLTIKGAVLPSTDGHLLQISDYIRRLEEDERGLFMGDFKRITFEGATVDYDDVEEIIRFTIEGWYDKNKRKPVQTYAGNSDLSMEGCASDEPEKSARKEASLDPSGHVAKPAMKP